MALVSTGKDRGLNKLEYELVQKIYKKKPVHSLKS